jgi:hypothetical protein
MFSVKSMMRSAAAVGGALVLLASGTSAASATSFTPTGSVVWKTSLTDPIKLQIGGGQQPWMNRTCYRGPTAGTGSVANTGYATITGFTLPSDSMRCTDGTGATFKTTITLQNQAYVAWSNPFSSTAYNGMRITDVGPGAALYAQPISIIFGATFVNGTTGIDGANPSAWKFPAFTWVGQVTDSIHAPGQVLSLSVKGSFIVGTATAPIIANP